MLAHIGLIFLALCLVAMLVLVVLGGLRVARAGAQLKKRIEAYRELPVILDIQRADARVARADRRAATIPLLLARARAAVLEIVTARIRLVLIVRGVGAALGFTGWFSKTS